MMNTVVLEASGRLADRLVTEDGWLGALAGRHRRRTGHRFRGSPDHCRPDQRLCQAGGGKAKALAGD